MNENPLTLASDIVDKARRLGADEVDAYIVSSTESSVQVRRGDVERVIDAGSHAVGLRVIKDKRTAICSTADLTPQAIEELVRDAVELASISEPDEYAGLPDRADLASGNLPSLGMFDEAIEILTTEEMRDYALRMESAMFDSDSRVTNSDGAEMGITRGQVVLANSLGFSGSYVGTMAALSIEAICDDADGKKRNDHWYSAERALHRLESPEDVGRRAAQRATAKIGARKVATTTVPVVWEAPVAHDLLRILSQAASGEALYRRSTFLAELEGQQVASSLLSLTDDPMLDGRLGSRPFDGEGVTSRTLPLFEGGRVPQLPLRHVQRSPSRPPYDRRGSAWRHFGAGAGQQQPRHGRGHIDARVALRRHRVRAAADGPHGLRGQHDYGRLLARGPGVLD